MNIGALQDAGLTANEATVYTTLLVVGKTTAGPLTKRSGLHRSRVYEALERLMEKGLVNYVIQGNRKYFAAQNPKQLLDIIDERRSSVKALLPELLLLQQEKTETYAAEVYEGYKGLKSIFDAILRTHRLGDEVLVFGARAGEDASPATWRAFFQNFNQQRERKRIGYKIIFNEELRNTPVPKAFLNAKYATVRFIRQKTPAGINIHGNKVAIILWKKNPIAFLLTGREIADSFREYFKILWGSAKK